MSQGGLLGPPPLAVIGSPCRVRLPTVVPEPWAANRGWLLAERDKTRSIGVLCPYKGIRVFDFEFEKIQSYSLPIVLRADSPPGGAL
jgi:hypothetical protein